MRVTVEKLPKSTLKINVIVPTDKVKETYNKTVDEVVKNAEIPGFRKGNAPKEKVLEKMDMSKVYGEVVNELLKTYYPQALKENHISPVSNPRVEIKQFDPEKDFEFVAAVATRPETKIGDYKKELKEIYENKKKTIQEQTKQANLEKIKKGEKIEESHIHLSVDEVIDTLVKTSELEIADILKDEEIDRMLARLVDQTQAIGLTIEQYLQAQNKTAEQLRAEYSIVAENNLKAEFILDQLITEQNIQVSESEIEETINASGDPKAKEQLQKPTQKWYIKSILAKNKLLAKLIEGVEDAKASPEGGHKHEHG